MVRASAAAAAVARDARPVRAAGQRGDAPADPGAAGRAVLRALARALSRRRRAGRGAGARRARRSGAGSATTAARWRCSARRGVVAERGWPADLDGAARRRAVHGGGGRVVRVGRQVAAVDTNVRRVLSRRDGVAQRRASSRAGARRCCPQGRAATFNQAMMELGATVCRPRAPRCGECPVVAGLPRAAARAAPRGPAVRFEDTDRWARGRIVAALLAGEELPVDGRAARARAGRPRARRPDRPRARRAPLP